MTLTRHSLIKCGTKGCPFTPDEHEEWMELCSRAPEHDHRDDQLSHQHIPKIGMGGNNPLSKIRAIICWPMHDRIDNRDWGNDVIEVYRDGQKVEMYRAFDLHNNTLIERPVLSTAAEEQRRGSNSVELSIPETEPSAAAPSAGHDGTEDAPPQGAEVLHSYPLGAVTSAGKEENDGTTSAEVGAGEDAGIPDESAKASSSLSGGGRASGQFRHGEDEEGNRLARTDFALTHEQRVAIAQQIKDTEWNRQWIAGDTANAWRAEMGEEAEQYISDFGYVQESIANIMRVCEAIPKNMRRSGLRFSHHVVMLGLNREDMEMWLDKCEEEQWSVAEFRRQVKGTKARVKRWSRPELQERWDGFWAVREQENPGWDFGSLVKVAFAKFLDWLSAEEQE